MASAHQRTGPTTPAGKRKAAANATKHGAHGAAVTLAGQYAAAVLQALGEKFPDPRFFRTGAGKPETSASRNKGIRQPDKIPPKQPPTNKTEHRQGAR